MALLERSECEVPTASSAQQGLNLATTCECDAVLLVHEMPGMEGHEVASGIKRASSETVVILLSRREVRMQAVTQVDAFPDLNPANSCCP